MGLLRSFKLLWYGTVSLGLGYLGISPLLEAFGLGPLGGVVQGDIKLLLIILAIILLVGAVTVGVTGYLVIGGWRAGSRVPRRLRLLLAVPVGIVTLILGGALSILVPIPVLPIVIAALLIWSILRFLSSQVFSSKPTWIDVDSAEELAVKFWRSRSPDDRKPTPLSASLDGDRWIITLTGKESTGRLDIDARSGIVTGWRIGE